MDDMTRQIAELLERTGLDPALAASEASQMVSRLKTVQEGSTYGAQWAEDLPRLWGIAARSGARRLVLEITAEGETYADHHGHLSVTVLERENWPAPVQEAEA